MAAAATRRRLAACAAGCRHGHVLFQERVPLIEPVHQMCLRAPLFPKAGRVRNGAQGSHASRLRKHSGVRAEHKCSLVDRVSRCSPCLPAKLSDSFLLTLDWQGRGLQLRRTFTCLAAAGVAVSGSSRAAGTRRGAIRAAMLSIRGLVDGILGRIPLSLSLCHSQQQSALISPSGARKSS